MDWDDLNNWWDSFVNSHSVVFVEENILSLDARWKDELQTGVEPWWLSHNRIQRQQYKDLLNLFEEVEDRWQKSPTPFTTDPLSVDWQSTNPAYGPLRTKQEENWSQWLAHLLRSLPQLASIAFKANPSSQPGRVHREKILLDHAGRNRKPDILAHYKDYGLHIEVKIDDENYVKTSHTAALVEHHYPELEWQHILLLPRRKQEVLELTFDEDHWAEESTRRLTIRVEGFPEIGIRHWEDVGQALRSILISEIDCPNHLQASAFIFCTLIEQKVIGYIPQSEVEKVMENPLLMGTGAIDGQLEYLREFMRGVQDG